MRMNPMTRTKRRIRSGGWLVGLTLLLGCDAWDLRLREPDVTNGLVAHYAFSGNTLDGSGNNLNGQLQNGATYGTDRNATAQSALLLDGLNDYFEIPDDPKLRLDAVSISLWINARRIDSTSHLYNKANWLGNANQQYSAFIKPPKPLPATDPCCQLVADVNQDGLCTEEQPILQALVYNDPKYSLNRWYHIVTVFSGKIAKIYVNGELKRSETEQPAGPVDKCAGGNLRFGAQQVGDFNTFHGSMDEIRIYNRLLTDAEVRALYQR